MGLPAFRDVEQLAQLRVQVGVGERTRRQLIAKEIAHDAPGADDGIKRVK